MKIPIPHPLVTLHACRWAARRLNRALVNDAAILTALEHVAREALLAAPPADLLAEAEREERDGWPR